MKHFLNVEQYQTLFVNQFTINRDNGQYQEENAETRNGDC